jgi:uncharacterized protein (TIGR03435 family)
MVFRNVPLSRLTNFLSVEAGRAVVDKTGLEGNYDFTLEFVSSRGALQPKCFLIADDLRGSEGAVGNEIGAGKRRCRPFRD